MAAILDILPPAYSSLVFYGGHKIRLEGRDLRLRSHLHFLCRLIFSTPVVEGIKVTLVNLLSRVYLSCRRSYREGSLAERAIQAELDAALTIRCCRRIAFDTQAYLGGAAGSSSQPAASTPYVVS